jgi:thioredoxin
MKIFGSITILAAALMLVSCGNASEPQNDNVQSISANEQQQSEAVNTSTPDQDIESHDNTNADKETSNKTVNDKPVHLTKDEFLKNVMNYEVNKNVWKFEGDLPCIIDFYADWCRPCKIIAPIMDDLAKEYKGKINIYKVNTEKEKELAAAFGIRSIPSLLFCPMEGNPQMTQGAQSKEAYKKLIEDYLLKGK